MTDPELLAAFLEDARTFLDAAAAGLAAPHGDAAASRIVERALHTLVGNAGLLGFEEEARMSRQALEQVRSGALATETGHAEVAEAVAALRRGIELRGSTSNQGM